MAKNQNTFEKRRRETEKKFRADEKRKKRVAKKNEDPRPAGNSPADKEPEEREFE
jgi:hypothetical protein